MQMVCAARSPIANGIHFLADVPLDRLAISDLNPRSHRDEARIAEIAEFMGRHGFDPAYALKAYSEGDGYRVFAGGNRLLAARRAGLLTAPVYVHEGLDRSTIWCLAYRDNEQAEKHSRLNPVDVWLDYAVQQEREGWSQVEMAKCLGVSETLVSFRIRLSKTPALHKPALVGQLDETHCCQILRVLVSTKDLEPWLTTEQAQIELVAEVLSKHRGSSAGIKPSVKVVREAAQRWLTLIQAAKQAYESLPEAPWNAQFVRLLADRRVRTEAGVKQALHQIVAQKRRADEDQAARLRAEADSKDCEVRRLQREEAKLRYVSSQAGKLLCGDARELLASAPSGFQLLLTDPPYGGDFQSHRRVTTARKGAIANDDKDDAVALLADVLTKAYPLMAEDATCLIFTGWRNEPEFRQVIQQAGFTIRGSLVWVKNNHGAGDLAGAFAPQHERIIHAVKGNPKLVRRAADVLSGHDCQDSEHPMEKPRDLLRQLIEAVTQPGDTVVDPFFGTGNTLLEAYALGRDFFGIELDEDWHRLAVEAIHHMAEEQCPHDLAS
jgi:site-specific DNA-methyltransferase (adenine-specific)